MAKPRDVSHFYDWLELLRRAVAIVETYDTFVTLRPGHDTPPTERYRPSGRRTAFGFLHALVADRLIVMYTDDDGTGDAAAALAHGNVVTQK